MSSINFNQSAMVALDTLRDINTSLQRTQNVISTGKKVATARDNAAVWSISTVMSTDVTSFRAITDSLNLGAATVGVARSAAEQVTGLLQEMKTLIVSAQQENVDRSKINTDVQALKEQVGAIVDAAQFNGMNLLKGGGQIQLLSSLDRAADGSVSIANISVLKQDLQSTQMAFGTGAGAVAGADAGFSAAQADGTDATLTFTAATAVAEGESYRVDVDGTTVEYVAREGDRGADVAAALSAGLQDIAGVTVSVSGSGDDAVLTVNNGTGAAINTAFTSATGGTAGGGLATMADIDVSTDQGAEDAITKIEDLLQAAIGASARFGSAQNRVDIQNDFIQSLVVSMEAGISALTDANLEEASARLQSLQVQQQLNIQALTIANSAPQSILALFR